MNEHEHGDEERESEEQESDAPAEAGTEPSDPEIALPPGAPKRFRAATDEELDPQSYIVSDDRSVLRAVLSGGSIHEDRADASFIGAAIEQLANALRKAADVHKQGAFQVSNPLLRHFAFTHSVVIELEASPEEQVQPGLDGTRHSPTIDAARTLGELLSADPEALMKRAVDIGPDAASAYKQFLDLLARDAVTLEWQAVEAEQVVVITSDDARRDVALLVREGEQETEPVEAIGRLTMADSDLRQFKLTLPSEWPRPPLLKGKHRVSGTYSEDMGVKLKSEGLWDSDVVATIEVTYDVQGTTPIPREPTYRLVDAEPLTPDAPALF